MSEGKYEPKVGDKVTFRTAQGRTGEGAVNKAIWTARGYFYEITKTDGNSLKLRAGNLTLMKS